MYIYFFNFHYIDASINFLSHLCRLFNRIRNFSVLPYLDWLYAYYRLKNNGTAPLMMLPKTFGMYVHIEYIWIITYLLWKDMPKLGLGLYKSLLNGTDKWII